MKKDQPLHPGTMKVSKPLSRKYSSKSSMGW
jgi:hypothetical protein